MNLKVLGKAMGFMFLPTLGVLLMLVVGFFDPIAMWNWIKSNDGWAIAVRIIIFLLETALVIVMYFNYLEDEVKRAALGGKDVAKSGISRSARTELYQLFSGTSSDEYTVFDTESSNIKVVQITKKRISEDTGPY